MNENLELLCVNAIRFLSVDAIERAKSGHPGLPMGAATAAYVLWQYFLKHNPLNPNWPDRDRFVLSAGHGSMLLYSLLHLTGYDLPMEELMNFRQWGSKTPGHPEFGLTPGVEITTGPLGQGISAAVGMALAERKLGAEFNRPGFEIVNHYTYVLASDGDLMEGVSSETSSLAGHWKLGKLIVLYDNNHISIDGSTDLAFSEDVLTRYKAYGWNTLTVKDSNDVEEIKMAIKMAREESNAPTLISIRTHIGYGSPKQDSEKAHGEPLGPAAIDAARNNLGWQYAPFVIPEEIYRHMDAKKKGMELEKKWKNTFEAYKKAFPELHREFERRVIKRELPIGWEKDLHSMDIEKEIATRSASREVLSYLAPKIPELTGGSADLTPSNKTKAPVMENFSSDNPTGSYIHFGVREHAMGTILNGLYLHGGFRPYGGTFLIFSDYMRPAIRLAAMMEIAPIYVFTHDSIALGEDGPTHQPIEQLMSLRTIPNLFVIRPADASEVAYAWMIALERKGGPTALILTRQKLPSIDRKKYASPKGVLRGGYILSEEENPQVVIVATGSEVHLALEAKEELRKSGIRVRVVSLPCWELFQIQEKTYQKEVLPPGVPTLAIEAGVSLGWDKYANGCISIDRFGASAPGSVVYKNFGFSIEHVKESVFALLEGKHRK